MASSLRKTSPYIYLLKSSNGVPVHVNMISPIVPPKQRRGCSIQLIMYICNLELVVLFVFPLNARVSPFIDKMFFKNYLWWGKHALLLWIYKYVWRHIFADNCFSVVWLVWCYWIMHYFVWKYPIIYAVTFMW